MANYKLSDSSVKAGYKGKRLTNENVNSFPANILKIWLKAGLIKEVVTTKKE